MTASAGKARSYALLLLRYRDRSEKEMRERLKKKGFQSDEIEAAVEYLRGAGYLDDRALADNLMRQALANRLLGFEGARRYMRDRGLSGDVINEALAYDEQTELQNIARLLEKKRKTLERYPEPKRTRSLVAFLMRKGYRLSVIRKAMKTTMIYEEFDA